MLGITVGLFSIEAILVSTGGADSVQLLMVAREILGSPTAANTVPSTTVKTAACDSLKEGSNPTAPAVGCNSCVSQKAVDIQTCTRYMLALC